MKDKGMERKEEGEWIGFTRGDGNSWQCKREGKIEEEKGRDGKRREEGREERR